MPGKAGYLPTIIAQCNTASHTGDAETISLTGGRIVVPKGFFAPGTTFRFTMFGNRAGTAGAVTLLIDINGTTVSTLAIPTNTAVDYMAQFTISEYTDFAHQRTSAFIATSATVLSAFDQDVGTVDVSQETVITAKMTVANASDDGYVNYLLVEYWQIPE